MTRWIGIALLVVAVAWARGDDVVTSDMNAENARVLRREQSGGTVSPTRSWTCENVQLEMARYGHPIMDCLMHNGNVWFRIDTAMTWQESWQACHAIAGGNLASVHSATDYATIRALYWFDQWKGAGNWLGLNKILSEADLNEYSEQYRWSDGTRFEYRKWSLGGQGASGAAGNCVYFGVVIGPVASTSASGSRKYSSIDGFANEDCNQLKMPICKVMNLTRT